MAGREIAAVVSLLPALLAQGDLALAELGFRRLGGLLASVVEVPGCGQAAFVLLLPGGFDNDPAGAAGLAQVRANYAEQLGSKALPAGAHASTEVLGDCIVHQLTLPAAAMAAAVGWCGAILQAGCQDGSIDADAAALAVARAALVADDAETLFPGPLLRSRARRMLLAGTAAGRWEAGEPTQIQALSGALQAWLLPPPGTPLLACIGGIDPNRLAPLLDALPVRGWLADTGGPVPAGPVPAGPVPAGPVPAGPVPAGPVPAGPVPAGPVPAGPVPVVRELPAVAAAFTVHARIAGPFATVAVEAPAVDQAMAFALAVEVLRARAAVQFRPHFDAAAVPYEARAQAPVVYYRWLEGDPCLFVTRRGADRAAFEPTLAEARSLLAGGHSQPATPAELAAAVQVLQREQALPPFAAGLTAALAAAPAGLAGRVRTLALYGWRGWRPARVTEMAAVPAAEVQRSLDRMAECASDCACGLLPGTPPPAAR